MNNKINNNLGKIAERNNQCMKALYHNKHNFKEVLNSNLTISKTMICTTLQEQSREKTIKENKVIRKRRKII